MMSFTDRTRIIEGRKTERMNFRTKGPVKAAIRHAAALAGVDDSTFVMNAALREAERVIEAHERTHLKAVDHVVFFSAMEAASEPGDALVTAARHYKARIASR